MRVNEYKLFFLSQLRFRMSVFVLLRADVDAELGIGPRSLNGGVFIRLPLQKVIGNRNIDNHNIFEPFMMVEWSDGIAHNGSHRLGLLASLTAPWNPNLTFHSGNIRVLEWSWKDL